MQQVLFALLLIFGVGYFVYNLKKIVRNIRLGKSIGTISDRRSRFRRMILLALGQRKLVFRPVSGVLHILVYLGFVVVNLEMLEIVIDGLFGTHRFFSFFGNAYDIFISIFEVFALLVILSVFIFWLRRNVLKISRLSSKELSGFASKDANFILFFEAFLMILFLLMNAFDLRLQELHSDKLHSFFITDFLSKFIFIENISFLKIAERLCWWLHIIGVLAFLNYLYFSKHLHILLAFPYSFYADISAKNTMNNIPSVTKEVKIMLGLEQDLAENQEIEKFGASEVTDLTQVQLLAAYTCTECGRCSAECPATQTGKLLSPRGIMMKTRDRLEEIGRNIDKNKQFIPDGKQLLGNYISAEELWACTSCSACVEACPIEISPMSIILEMRRFLVMERTEAPQSINTMFAQMENNGAPWAYNSQERMNWVNQ